MRLVQVLILLNICLVAWSYRILVICAFPSKSHCTVFEKISLGLMEKQHDTTFVSYFPIEKPPSNYTSVDLRQPGHSYLNFLDMKMFTGTKLEKWLVMNLALAYTKKVCGKDFGSDKIRTFLEQSGPFDVIIAPMLNSECYLSFMYKFGAPVVGLSTVSVTEWISEKFGLPSNPAYIPNTLSDLVKPTTFVERIDNLLMGVFQRLYYEILIVSTGEKTAKEYFGEGLPPLSKLVYNVSMLLVNNHFNVHVSRPLVPAVVEIGGIHLGKICGISQVVGFSIFHIFDNKNVSL
ncbi:hypothetical protein Zmor_010050 [Zophobas morio]|uniref:Glucuronosyltransferase n=1 Tax=Zophobas morio TaxID=2755281 RepID=A0AA38IPY8_9CUCU|nr:hypothetical protein Zmor_010050 [Zophobas morio]